MKKISKFVVSLLVVTMVFAINLNIYAKSDSENEKLKIAYEELVKYGEGSDYSIDITYEDFVNNYNEAKISNIDKYLDEYYTILSINNSEEITINSSSSGGGNTYYYNIGTSLPSDVQPDYSKYNLKDVVKKGDIIYEDNGGFGITGHIAIVEGFYYNADQDVTYIRLIEAISDGVVRSLLDDTRVDDKDVTIFRVDDASTTDKANAISFCVGEIGSTYSLDFAKDTSSSETDWYCSELVWAAYYNEDIDVEKSGFSEPGVTPHDIRDSSELSEISFEEQ